jgi:uncharacterized protein (DUF488 family)
MPYPNLYTIGYEGTLISEFLSTLRATGIQLVIDVRELPLSRKKGFSKSSLAQHLQDRDIGYLHLRGLGDPKEGRLAARAGRFNEFKRIFSSHMKTSIARNDMTKAIDASLKHVSCLVCFERDHANCHRCMVAEEMARTSGLKLTHLVVNNSQKSVVLPVHKVEPREVHGFIGQN